MVLYMHTGLQTRLNLYASVYGKVTLRNSGAKSEIPKITFNHYAYEALQVSKRFRQKYYSLFMLTVLI